MATIENGPRVKFFRAHDQQHALVGQVVEIRDGEALVKTEPDGVLVWANADDCKEIEADAKAEAEDK